MRVPTAAKRETPTAANSGTARPGVANLRRHACRLAGMPTRGGAFILFLAALGSVTACSEHAAVGSGDAGADSQCAALGEVQCNEAPWLHCAASAHGYQCNTPAGPTSDDPYAECEGGTLDPACGGYIYDFCCTFSTDE